MVCPKCGHNQNSGTECERCGIIFARYEAIQKRRKEEAKRLVQSSDAKQSGIGKLLSTVLLIAVVAGTTYYFTRSKYSDPSDTGSLSTQSESVDEPLQIRDSGAGSTGGSTSSHDNRDNPVSIEQARNATVSIETPWGTGSGFFVDKNYIVTNKHVIEFDQQKLDEAKEKLSTNRRLLDLEEEKLRNLRRRLKNMPSGPERSQLQIILREREKQLAQYLQQQEKGEKNLEEVEKNAQYPAVEVILSDGSRYTAEYIVTSQEYDLALLSLFAYDGTPLKRAPSSTHVKQGDKVFTIGSPVGLRHTVTSGVFSGYRKRESDDHLFLQTDAPINPGNSGGPLIDEKGHVLGVNTMILRDTEGIGFAIPIDRVFSEFETSLP
jgi:serine protease Do